MSNAEMLLALRSPSAGWLAAVVCALDEAMLDPAFDEAQRDVLRDLLERGNVPNSIALAAHANLLNFEIAMQARRDMFGDAASEMPAAPRQKLTLAVSNS